MTRASVYFKLTVVWSKMACLSGPGTLGSRHQYAIFSPLVFTKPKYVKGAMKRVTKP